MRDNLEKLEGSSVANTLFLVWDAMVDCMLKFFLFYFAGFLSFN